MGRETRGKLARAFARQQDHERNRTMQLRHSDKSLGNHETKLSAAAQAAFDLNTARLRADAALTPDERSWVGKQVARAAEVASLSPERHELRSRMKRAARPTDQEQAQIDRALAAWEAANLASRKARQIAREEAQEASESAWNAERSETPLDVNELTRLRAKVSSAERAVPRAERDEGLLSEDLGRLRGEAVLAGAQRVRELVSRGI